jgi:hypothetical protein
VGVFVKVDRWDALSWLWIRGLNCGFNRVERRIERMSGRERIER